LYSRGLHRSRPKSSEKPRLLAFDTLFSCQGARSPLVTSRLQKGVSHYRTARFGRSKRPSPLGGLGRANRSMTHLCFRCKSRSPSARFTGCDAPPVRARSRETVESRWPCGDPASRRDGPLPRSPRVDRVPIAPHYMERPPHGRIEVRRIQLWERTS